MTPYARAEILAAIRRAQGAGRGDRAADQERIPRNYAQFGPLDLAGRRNLLLDRLHDYGAGTSLCTLPDMAKAIARTLDGRGKHGAIVPAGFPDEWLPAGFEFTRDTGQTARELDRAEGVITLCALAISLTGTLVLRDGAPGQGRRALSLVPDYHLCIVDDSQIVETAPEAIRALGSAGTAAALTTISGPSATADIEMTRIKGVHGPRTLDVIIASSGA